MPTSELRNKARPELCGSLGTGYRLTGTGCLSRINNKYKEMLARQNSGNLVKLERDC